MLQHTQIAKKVVPKIFKHYSLYPNYPNPFNSTTVIRYQIKETSRVTLKVYDLLGSVVDALVNETQQAGQYQVVWNNPVLSSGIFFAGLRRQGWLQQRKCSCYDENNYLTEIVVVDGDKAACHHSVVWYGKNDNCQAVHRVFTL